MPDISSNLSAVSLTLFAWDHHFQKAAKLRPTSGHTKFMYLGQMSSGVEAIGYFKRGIELMTKECGSHSCASAVESSGNGASLKMDISNAYCSMAEVYLTDLWSVNVRVSLLLWAEL